MQQTTARPRVVVGVDGSLPSVFAIHWAAHQARLRGAELCAVIVDETRVFPAAPYAPTRPPAAGGERSAVLRGTLVESIAAALGPCPDLAVHEHVEEGHPADVLARYTAGAALLVLGSHRRDVAQGAELGPTIRGSIRAAVCPVAVVTEGTEVTATDELVPEPAR